MSDLTDVLLAQRPDRLLRLVYGVASGDNTVAVRGADTAVELPALTPVKSGDYCAVLEAGADRLILGPVGGIASGIYADDGSAIPNNSQTGVTLTATSDPRGWLGGGGNVIPDVAGFYKVTVDVKWPSAAYTRTNVQIRKNNTNLTGGLSNIPDVSSGSNTNSTVAVVEVNGTSDTLDFTAFQDSGSNQTPSEVLFLVELLPGH